MLQPPADVLNRSIVYGLGFSSVLPSERRRQDNPEWPALERLAHEGLYRPLWLRDLLDAPEVAEEVESRLRSLARRRPFGSSSLHVWNQRVGQGEQVNEGDYQQVFLSLPPDAANPDATALPASDTSIAGLLVEQFAFARSAQDERMLVAPRQVVNEVVTAAVDIHVATHPGYVPTSLVKTTAGELQVGERDESALQILVTLPELPSAWTLEDALAFRTKASGPLTTIREILIEAYDTIAGGAGPDELVGLSAQMEVPALLISRALGNKSRRPLVKSLALPLGIALAESAVLEGAMAALPEVGPVGAIALGAVATVALPDVRRRFVPRLPKGLKAYQYTTA